MQLAVSRNWWLDAARFVQRLPVLRVCNLTCPLPCVAAILNALAQQPRRYTVYDNGGEKLKILFLM